MFITRLLSGIILVAIALASITKGGIILAALLLFLSIMGMREFYKAARVTKQLTLMELVSYIGAGAYFAVLYFNLQKFMMMTIVAVFLALMVIYVVSYPNIKNREVTVHFFGFFYVAVMLGFMYMTRCRFKGAIEVWLIFLSSWGADTCAYCVGMLFGKHKMTPVLSPKKSVEGAIGGVVGAALLAMIYAIIFKQPIVLYMVIAAIAAVVSIFGDLAASAVKRQYNIKDYGKLIPGHGGVLDRFDSVIFTAPIIYYCSVLLLG
ncbi:MAG: phosphatidate cytidylyltransferase [Lachnospiraceae bacterium]|nr:phosphatidate cytidylyltransferase [Lachnospiraceae bacterium]